MANEAEIPKIKPLEIAWHQPLIERLQGMKQQDRLPHALLIELASEEEGIEFVWHLSMSLLCTQAVDTRPCGECDACRLMLANTYPDFINLGLISNEKTKKINKNINIEQIRDLIHKVHLTRQYDNLKLVSIYPAEKLNIASANSLLKTVEEPAPQVLILLVTHNKGRLPITIRSRCQVWTLQKPEKQLALDWLQARGLDAEAAGQYLDYAAGDPLTAMKLNSLDYAEMVDGFKQEFAVYLGNKLDVSTLSGRLVKSELSLIRRLIKMVINAYCFALSGLGPDAQNRDGAHKLAAREILALSDQSDKNLMIEDNNLNLQIQLEDVLISLKQIIQRSKR